MATEKQFLDKEGLDRLVENTQAAVDAAALKVFNDRWNTACGNYGGYKPDEAPDKSKPYLLNDMWFSYAEALLIDRESMPIFWQSASSHAVIQSRTLYPLHSTTGYYGNPAAGGYEFALATKLEVVRFIDGYNHIRPTTFMQCSELREIRGGYIRLGETGDYFNDSPKLTTVQEWRQIDKNFSIVKCPLLTYSTIDALVKGCTGTSHITVTVHPDIYAALTGDASEYPFNGGTQEQWAQILTDAAQKQVSFGTI